MRSAITAEGSDMFAAHGSIPIRFAGTSRVDLEVLRESSGRDVREIPTAPFEKDYDDFEEERPENLSKRFDTSGWTLLTARAGDRRIGGIILAVGCDYPLLDSGGETAVIVDLRVSPDFRGLGIGRSLFEAGVNWASTRGCRELRVETQDINVAACRFYAAMGCHVLSAEPGAYGPQVPEARVIWRLLLAGGPGH